MKVGDKEPVHIGVHQVAMAEVREIADGQVVLVIPATRIVMGLRTELTDLPQAPAPAKETIIDSAERSSAVVGGETPNVTDSTTSSPVVETQENITTPAEAAEVTPPAAVDTTTAEASDAGNSAGSVEAGSSEGTA